MNRLITYLFFTAFIFSSCRKNKSNDANSDPRGFADSELIGNWKIIAVVSDVSWDWDGNGIPEKNIYNTWSVCQKDNLYNFSADFTGIYKFNCSHIETGRWVIIDTKFLEYAVPSIGVESEKLIFMNSVEFKTTKDYTLANGQPATVTKTWLRQ